MPRSVGPNTCANRGRMGAQLNKAAPSSAANAVQGPSQTLIGASDLMALFHHTLNPTTRTPQSDARTVVA